MPYKIISPTGVSVEKSLEELEVEKLKREGYFTVVSLRPRIHIGDIGCSACEA